MAADSQSGATTHHHAPALRIPVANESMASRTDEKWHGVPVLPRARKVLETELRKLAPAAQVMCFSKMVRSAGLAPASPDWHSGILLLNDDREMRRGLHCGHPRRL